MKILVTGRADFVGSHVVDVLKRPQAEGDTRKPNEIVSEGEADAIVHCQDDSAMLTSNAVAALETLIAAVPRGTPFVYVSSCFVDSRSRSRANTNASVCESVIMEHHQAGRISGRVVRLPLCVGPRYRRGHIAYFVDMVRESGKIVAEDWGWSRLPYIHVVDAAEAIAAAGLAETNGGAMIEASAGYWWSARDTVALMRATSSRAFDVSWQEDTVIEPQDLEVRAKAPRRSVAEGVVEALRGLGWE